MDDLARTWDLAEILQHSESHGVVWTQAAGELDLQLHFFRAGEGVASQVNVEADVVGLVLEGEAQLDVDGKAYGVHGGQAFFVPHGARYAVRCSGGRVAYLAVRHL